MDTYIRNLEMVNGDPSMRVAGGSVTMTLVFLSCIVIKM